MAQEYQQPVDSTTSPLPQRMTADESRAVIALWQQEQAGVTDQPAVPDVAEGLEITLEDVQRLLLEVRAKRQTERALTAEQVLLEIRLAENSRQLAEIERQRAELRREQAEAERRRHSDRRHSDRPQSLRPQSLRPQNVRPLRPERLLRRAPVPRRVPQGEQDALGRTYLVGGILLFLWFASCLYYVVATALP